MIELIAISLICIGIQENSSGEVMRLAANIAWRHHERYDGKGYQNELSGEKINLYARSVPWLSLKTKTN
nr:HD domain-containing phosphohydrolase [uncultured Treponema sp.]